jgi:hypothetical protein
MVKYKPLSAPTNNQNTAHKPKLNLTTNAHLLPNKDNVKNAHPLTVGNLNSYHEFDLKSFIVNGFGMDVKPGDFSQEQNIEFLVQSVVVRNPTLSKSKGLQLWGRGLTHRIDGIPINEGEGSIMIMCFQPLNGVQSFQFLDNYVIDQLVIRNRIQKQKFKIGNRTYNGTDMISPCHFAGYSKMNNAYFVVLAAHRTNSLRRSPLAQLSQTLPQVTFALEKMLIGVLKLGYLPRDNVKDGSYIIEQGKKIHVKLTGSNDFQGIPVDMHKRLVKKLQAGESLVAAWHDVGGYTWYKNYNLKFKGGGGIDNVVVLQQMALSAVKNAEGADRDRLLKMVPFMNTSTENPRSVRSRGWTNSDHIYNHLSAPAPNKMYNFTKPILNQLNFPQNWKTIGKGAYGCVLESNTNDKNLKYLHDLKNNLKNVQFHGFPDPKSDPKFVIKIQTMKSANEFHGVLREAHILNRLRSTSVMKKGTVIRGTEFIPPFFFSGMFGHKHVICMGRVEGRRLFDIIQKYKYMPKPVFAKLERAVEFMLRAGIVHSDFHSLNILVDKELTRNPKLTIIDFGFAIEIPLRLKNQVSKILDKTGSIDDAWVNSGLDEYVNLKRSKTPWFHSNMKMLRYASSMTEAPSRKQQRLTPVPATEIWAKSRNWLGVSSVHA